MKCPHCQIDYFENWKATIVSKHESSVMRGGVYDGDKYYIQTEVATCPNCHGSTVFANFHDNQGSKFTRFQVYPRGGKFPAAPPEVPGLVSSDYAEANEVLGISPKASAALSRRCLQAILSSHGYNDKNLVKQVESAIAETDASKSLPSALRENIDAIRNFGNFSAHPITDQTTLQVVEVEEGEAEWCLQILLDLFDHYYVAPAKAAAKRAALGAKLAAAGKPPMKQ